VASLEKACFNTLTPILPEYWQGIWCRATGKNEMGWAAWCLMSFADRLSMTPAGYQAALPR